MAVTSSGPVFQGKHAVVVGAGPSGAIAAIHLARAGFQVSVYERTQAQAEGGNSTAAVGPRSYGVMLSRRGMAALEGAGVNIPDDQFLVIPKMARYIKTKKPVHMPGSTYARIVNRGTLAGHLISKALRLHPDRIRVHFGAELEDLDLRDRRAVFLTADGKRDTAQYDLLVGSDGASSRVRSFMQQQVPGFSFTQVKDDMEYKAFELPSMEHADPGSDKYFIVMVDQATNSSIIATPSPSGPHRATYIATQGVHDSMVDMDAYVKAMKASFPCFLEEQYYTMATQLIASPVSTGGTNTRCSQLHGPGVVLVGDAGHSMWPTLGQGANSALESAAVLGRVLAEAKDLSAVPETYNTLRHADALAVVELTQRGWGGRRQRTTSAVNLGMMKLMGQFMAHKMVPGLVPKPALMTLNDTFVRYSEALRASELHSQVANLVLISTALTVGAGLLVAAGVKPPW